MHHKCKVHNVEQGTPEWHQARNGLLTASEVKLILTPTLKPSNNDKTRAHVFELAAQRINNYTEPTYVNDSMLRGHSDEILAREAYSDKIEPLEELGFITRDFETFTMGFSPDGSAMMGNSGWECKSRMQKFQVETVVSNEIPNEHILQVQAGLMVTGWDYIDYTSYCGGMPMWNIRSEPIPEYQEAIHDAAAMFELKINDVIETYMDRLSQCRVVIETEREEEGIMI